MPYEYGVVKIKLRRDTATNLSNVVLASGEPAFATDTNVLKIGNGSATFSSLSGIGGTGGGGGGGSSTFLGLIDSPSTFTSSANKLVAVNSSANAVVFVENSGATALQSGDNISLLNNDSGYLINVAEDTTPQLSGTGDIHITSDDRRAMIVDGDNSVHLESASILLRSDIDGTTDENGLLIMKYGSSGNPHAYIWNYTSGSQIIFGVNNMQSMKLMPDGKLGINQVGTTPSYYLTVNGDAWVKENIQASGFVTPSGTSSQFLKADGSVDSTTYGDITAVVAGTGLTGGGSTGSVNINIDGTVIQSGDNISKLNNDAGYITSASGDITAVVAGTGLSGGGTTGSVTVNIDSTVIQSGDNISKLNNNVNYVSSNTGTAGGGTTVQNMVTIGAAAYSGLTPNAGTLYFITGA